MRTGRRLKSLGTLSLLAGLVAGVLPVTAAQTVRAMDMPSMPGMKMPGMNMSGDVMRTANAGAYRIELHVLSPEPFYSTSQVDAQHPAAGMLVVGGAAPWAPNASPAPNHHLIVHVFKRDGGQAVSDASVSISYRAVDPSGQPTGEPISVPIVTMRAIGGGAASTHYGNNVQMAPGSYVVTVTVNGATATFQLSV